MFVTRAGREPRAVLREVGVLLRFLSCVGGRDPRRTVAAVLGAALLLVVVVPVVVAAWAPRQLTSDVLLLSPALWSFVLVVSVGASLASGGGRELLPRAGSVFPVSPTADHLGALLLSPLNIAWSIQAALLLAATGYVVGLRWALVGALLATVMWLVAATTVAQLLGWGAELVRTYRHGRSALWGLVAAGVVTSALLVRSGRAGGVLDQLPTAEVYVGAFAGPLRYTVTQLGVLLVAVVAFLAAVPVVERLQRRPAPSPPEDGKRRFPRTGAPRSELQAAVRLDLRSVLRSPPLRRGLTLLLGAPLLVVVVAPLPWLAITLLPGLLGAGTALLYGVNAVGLDGRGAAWRESLPHRPDVTLVGRLLALTLLCGGSSALLVVVAALSAVPPNAAEVTAVVVAVVVATAQVVSRCAVWSIRSPYPAELRRPRDTPAPPVAMAGYSVRLSVACTLAALGIATGAVLADGALSVAVGSALLVPSMLRLRRAFRRHQDLAVRAAVAATVGGA